MASKLRFSDGTTTVTFDGTTDGKIVKYDILAPELRTLTVSKVTSDGSEVIAQAYNDVTETMDLYIAGTWSQITTTIRKLNRMWERVRRYQDSPIESAVYIGVMPDGDTEYYRSELKAVETDLEPQALDLFLGQGKIIFSVTITRAYFWEKETEVELALYNPVQAKGTGGKQVNNCRDSNGAGADRYNYLDIDNADLIGDLPARLRLKITNDYNHADALTHVFMGLAFKTDVVNFAHVIEGESTSYGTQKPGAADYTLYSEGYYRELTWSNVTYEQTLGSWALPSAVLSATKSNYFMVYARCVGSSSPSDLYLRTKINAVDLFTLLWLGPQVLFSGGGLICLGAVQLPPVRQISGTPYPENFVVTAQVPSGVAGHLDIDYLLFLPMERWRQLIYNNWGVPYNAYLMDDGINEQLYIDGQSTAGQLYSFVGYGPWFEVTPVPETSGRHRMVFLGAHDTTASVLRTLNVRAYYRPRRKQI
jgi:hypothetical protein